MPLGGPGTRDAAVARRLTDHFPLIPSPPSPLQVKSDVTDPGDGAGEKKEPKERRRAKREKDRKDKEEGSETDGAATGCACVSTHPHCCAAAQAVPGRNKLQGTKPWKRRESPASTAACRRGHRALSSTAHVMLHRSPENASSFSGIFRAPR